MKFWSCSALVLVIACSSSENAPSPTSSSSAGGSSGSSGSGGSSATSSGAAGGPTSSSTGGASTGGQAGSGTGGDARDASSDGPPAGDGSTNASQVCATFASTLCTKLQACSSFVLGVLYGDESTCEKRIVLSCVPAFAAPGTSATPTKTAACGQSLASLGCDAFLKGDFGASCKTDPGTVAVDGPCADDAQCASTFCARAPDAACGVCQPPTTVGGACVRSSCSAGQVCPAGQSKCIAPAQGKVDDMCTAQEQCDLAHAVGCNTTTNKCIALTLAQGMCGANSLIPPPTSYAVCPANGTCSAAFAGRCNAAAADGASCSTADTGTHCVSPARCVGAKCTVPDPSTCH